MRANRRTGRASALATVALLAAVRALSAEPVPPDGEMPPEEPLTLGDRWRSGWRHVAADGKHLVTFPRRPTARGKVATAAVVGGIGVLLLLDHEIRDDVQRARDERLDRWERRIEPLGRGETTAVASVSVWAVGKLTDRPRIAETGRAMIESLAFTQAFTVAAKGLTARSAPSDRSGAGRFLDGGTIFPSGHTSRAFALATVLAHRHGRAAAWIAYPLAGLVGLFRIVDDSHWASDVLAGAALGFAVADTVVRLRDRRAAARRGFGVTAYGSEAGFGLMLRIPVGG